MRPLPKIVRESSQKRPDYNICYRPGYCKNINLEYAYCVSLALYNFYSAKECELTNYQLIGDESAVIDIYNMVNRLNHIVGFLTLARFQANQTKVNIDKLVDCKFLECVKKEFSCLGFDITCIYKCFQVCDYCNNCNECKKCDSCL